MSRQLSVILLISSLTSGFVIPQAHAISLSPSQRTSSFSSLSTDSSGSSFSSRLLSKNSLKRSKSIMRVVGGGANHRNDHSNTALLSSKSYDSDSDDEKDHDHRQEVCLTSETKRKGLFAITYLAYIAIYFARKPLSVLKPVLEKELGISRVALGNMDTVLLGSYAVGQLLLGQIMRFASPRTILTWSFIVTAASTALFGTCSDTNMMTFYSGLSGIGSAAGNPLLVLFIGDLFPPSMRASAVGLWQTSSQFGGIVANNLASLIYSLYGWRAVFYAGGIMTATFILPVYLALKPSDTTASTKTTSSSASINSGGNSNEQKQQVVEKAPSTSQVISMNGALSITGAYSLIKMVRYCLMLWLPTFFTVQVGMEPAQAGVMSSLFDAGGVAGGVAAGFITDRVAGGQLVSVAASMSMLGAASLAGWAMLVMQPKGALLNPVAWHGFAMLVAGFLIAGPDGIFGGAASKNLCDYNHKSAADGYAKYPPAVSGVVNGIASLSLIMMSAQTSNIVNQIGWSGLFVLLSVMSGGATLAALPALRMEKKYFKELADKNNLKYNKELRSVV